jgi:hypothetical protein
MTVGSTSRKAFVVLAFVIGERAHVPIRAFDDLVLGVNFIYIIIAESLPCNDGLHAGTVSPA